MTKFKRNGTRQKDNKLPAKIKNDNKMNGDWLTYNQKLFADEWLKDRNATRAHKVAYPNTKGENTHASAGSQLLRNLKIDKYLQRRLAKISKKAEIDTEWVLRGYKRLVDYSLEDLYDDDHNLLPVSQMSENARFAVCGIKSAKNKVKKTSVKGATTDVESNMSELKFTPKKEIFDKVGEHLGMFARDDDNPKGGTYIDKAVINIQLTD